MKTTELMMTLRKHDIQGQWCYSLTELGMMFPDDQQQQLKNALGRQVKAGNLTKVGNGLYAYPYATSSPAYKLEHLLGKMRPREMSYISLESALSLYGIISQIPLAGLTVMTTGRSYMQDTPWGVIEWVHTAKSESVILMETVWDEARGCLIATPDTALRDLRNVGRNLDLVRQDYEQ